MMILSGLVRVTGAAEIVMHFVWSRIQRCIMNDVVLIDHTAIVVLKRAVHISVCLVLPRLLFCTAEIYCCVLQHLSMKLRKKHQIIIHK